MNTRSLLRAQRALVVFSALLSFSFLLSAQTAVTVETKTVHATKTDKGPRPVEFRDLTYLKIGENNLTLDVYQNPKTGSAPVLVYFHGGGWVKGERPHSYTSFRSYLAMGFSVVSVDYRLAPAAPAPAAVQDARCALSWVKQNAVKYHFDLDHVVVYGTSAGGHLALMGGMMQSSANVDLPQCADLPKVAAILDFYGPTDLIDITGPANTRGWASRWITDAPNAADMAKRMSPMTYVRSGLPATFIVHGDADPTVPYDHSVRLQKALNAVGIPNQLFTVAGGAHGKFDDDQKKAVTAAIQEFLRQQKVLQ